jgi:hypothetical protein
MAALNDITKNQEVEYDDAYSIGEIITRPFNPNDIEIETPPFTVGYLIDSIRYEEINSLLKLTATMFSTASEKPSYRKELIRRMLKCIFLNWTKKIFLIIREFNFLTMAEY